ncbi:hypothetical protein M422DRAFT_242657 [Sphaerobolus stellatus SS14]|nr:hypothetical protein M422DRAFT_242657 [Sphaerobolus stellatus SS14]
MLRVCIDSVGLLSPVFPSSINLIAYAFLQSTASFPWRCYTIPTSQAVGRFLHFVSHVYNIQHERRLCDHLRHLIIRTPVPLFHPDVYFGLAEFLLKELIYRPYNSSDVTRIDVALYEMLRTIPPLQPLFSLPRTTPAYINEIEKRGFSKEIRVWPYEVAVAVQYWRLGVQDFKIADERAKLSIIIRKIEQMCAFHKGMELSMAMESLLSMAESLFPSVPTMNILQLDCLLGLLRISLFIPDELIMERKVLAALLTFLEPRALRTDGYSIYFLRPILDTIFFSVQMLGKDVPKHAQDKANRIAERLLKNDIRYPLPPLVSSAWQLLRSVSILYSAGAEYGTLVRLEELLPQSSRGLHEVKTYLDVTNLLLGKLLVMQPHHSQKLEVDRVLFLLLEAFPTSELASTLPSRTVKLVQQLEESVYPYPFGKRVGVISWPYATRILARYWDLEAITNTFTSSWNVYKWIRHAMGPPTSDLRIPYTALCLSLKAVQGIIGHDSLKLDQTAAQTILRMTQFFLSHPGDEEFKASSVSILHQCITAIPDTFKLAVKADFEEASSLEWHLTSHMSARHRDLAQFIGSVRMDRSFPATAEWPDAPSMPIPFSPVIPQIIVDNVSEAPVPLIPQIVVEDVPNAPAHNIKIIIEPSHDFPMDLRSSRQRGRINEQLRMVGGSANIIPSQNAEFLCVPRF